MCADGAASTVPKLMASDILTEWFLVQHFAAKNIDKPRSNEEL